MIAAWSQTPRGRVALLGALALVVHLCLRVGLPGAQGMYTPLYKGDAPVWHAYAESLTRLAADPGLPLQQQFELGLPLRPPGMGYLAFWFGDGWSLALLIMGVALAPMLYWVARPIGERVAWVAGLCTASSAVLAALSASLNNEVPYLFVVLASWLSLERIRVQPSLRGLVVFGALQGAALLIRVEHALLALLVGGWLLAEWRRARQPLGRHMLAALVPCVLVLVPWHVHAWRTVARFQAEETSPLPLRSALPWEPPAREAVAALPGFLRGTMFRILEATVQFRGGPRVTVGDLAILEEAFGAMPASLPEHPFVALYGPLNFALANHADAGGGFDTSLFARPAPFPAGEGQFPPAFVRASQGFPQLKFEYPPHLELLRNGYVVGLRWMLGDPLAYLSLVGRKIVRFWGGAAHGFGAAAWPLGWSGVRHRVEVAFPTGTFASVWRVLFLVVVLAGIRSAWRARERTAPWLLWLGALLVITAAFFGYARHGGMAVPALAVLIGCAVADSRIGAWCAWAFVAVVLVASGWCAVSGSTFVVDGRPTAGGDPWPAMEFADRTLEVR